MKILLILSLFIFAAFFAQTFSMGKVIAATEKSSIVANDIDDGISGWQEQTNTVAATVTEPSYPGKGLIYSFGSLKGGELGSAESVLDSEVGGVVKNGQPNIGILDGTKTVRIYYGGTQSLYANGTSMAYGIVFDPNARANPIEQYSVLVSKLSDKKYFVAKDNDGHIAMKVMGNFSRDGHRFLIEILLRPGVSDGNAKVYQDMYVKNISNTSDSFGVFYGGDTQLGNDDGIPIKSLGNNEGMYIEGAADKESGSTTSTTPKYKLLLKIEGKDKPTDFTGSERIADWLSGFASQKFSGSGIVNTSMGLERNKTIYDGMDSSYTLKWPYQTLQPGKTYHVQHEIQGLIGKIVRPEFSKTYQNLTAKDGKNHIGDQVKFTLNVENNGYQDALTGIKLDDHIDTFFNLDVNSIKLVKADGTKEAVPAAAYDPKTRKLSIPVKETVSDNQVISIEYTTQIDATASGKTVSNTGYLDCFDQDNNHQEFKKQATVSFDVVEAPYISTFKKQVKNITKGDKDFSEQTEGRIGDTVKYHMEYTVDSSSKNSLSSGELKDPIAGELDVNNIDVSYSTGGAVEHPSALDKIPIKSLPVGGKVIVEFDAKINDKAKPDSVIKNIGHFSAKTDSGNTIENDSNEADITVKKPQTGKITLRYIDRESNMANPKSVATEVTYTGKLNSKLFDHETQPDATGASPKFIDGWTVVDYTENADLTNATYYQAAKKYNPVFSEDEQIITYRYEPKMISFSVPDNWDFGNYDISKDENYYLRSQLDSNRQRVPYELQVKDYYGVDSWSVDVTQTDQFKTSTKINGAIQELKGAQLSVKNGTLIGNKSTQDDIANPKVNGQQTVDANNPKAGEKDIVTSKANFNFEIGKPVTGIINYQKAGHYKDINNSDADNTVYDNPGTGEWHYQFGDQTTKDISIGLHIPASTERYKAYYATTLTWNLNLTP